MVYTVPFYKFIVSGSSEKIEEFDRPFDWTRGRCPTHSRLDLPSIQIRVKIDSHNTNSIQLSISKNIKCNITPILLKKNKYSNQLFDPGRQRQFHGGNRTKITWTN
jgi:hypothetical protein